MTPPNLTRVWTREELEEHLADALAIVDTLGPPDDLRVQLFATAANALLQVVVDPRPAAISAETLERLARRE